MQEAAPDRSPATMGHSPRDALALWRRVVVEGLDKGVDLSARQMAILLTVYDAPGPHTVRGLASGLGLHKPAITRALDMLGRAGLVRRKRDPLDRRSVLVQRTVKGSVFLNDFGERVIRLTGMQ